MNGLDPLGRPVCIYCLDAVGTDKITKYEGLVCRKCYTMAASCRHAEWTPRYLRLPLLGEKGTHLVIFTRCTRCSFAYPVFGLNDDGPIYEYELESCFFGKAIL